VSRQHRQLQPDYWKAIHNMCRRSDAVVCASEAQRSHILRFCDNVHVVPDTHYAAGSDVKKDYAAAAPVKLVWTGLPSNIVGLRQMRGVLRDLSRRHAIQMHVVTASDGFRFLNKWWKVPSTELVKRTLDQAIVHAWDAKTAAKIITECDIAVIPIDLRDPMAAGKSQNKLIFLWRMGMPVVTSATPAYTRAMEEAGMSLTCRDNAEWIATLEKLMLDEAVRRDAGVRGRQYALRHFSEAQVHGKWDGVFRSIGFDLAGR
jgi:glycosyltransferase involved in cell wall biosynthesis